MPCTASNAPTGLIATYCLASPGGSETDRTVARTVEGFVALRDHPSTTGREIARIRPGEAVMIEREKPSSIVPEGWVHVRFYPGTAFPERWDPDYRKVRRGWIPARLATDCAPSPSIWNA
ncbi:MAG TPA: hypothetical protein PKW21_07010 [Rhabdaerophilum sp.]|nr:hypothetical protein [Rhabdaerophilum sp.]